MASNAAKNLMQEVQDRMTLIDTSNNDQATRKEAAEMARQLWVELEEPGDLVDRVIYSPVEMNLLHTAVDLGLYARIASAEGSLGSGEIAHSLGTDHLLMRRILRCLAALGHIQETDADRYAANKLTYALMTDKGVCGMRVVFNFLLPAFNAIPAYLKKINYRNPADANNTPLQHGYASSDHFFEILVKHGNVEDFSKLMSAFRDGRAEFIDVYPFAQQILRGASYDADSIVLVDVGGAQGLQIVQLVQRYPAMANRMILQDRPEVVQHAARPDVMRVMAHDFFEPQPVKGARAYYMRMILHDWPDDQCVIILKQLAGAMKPGYPKVLVNDTIMPDKGATRFMAQSDITMMTLLAAMERDEAQWRRLFERAGLKVVGLWQATPESVFELELA